MSKNKFSDPITDQEMAFACLVLSGTMTDQRAAKAVGLNPHNAASLKCKPCVRAYMLEQHRARVQQQSVEKEAEEIRRLNPSREQSWSASENRQHDLGNDPRQHYRPGEGPFYDRSH